MASLDYIDHPTHLNAVRQAILAAADAGAAVTRVLHLKRASLVAGSHRFPLTPNSRLFVVALGKAAPAMTHAAAGIVGPRLAGGVVTVPTGRPIPAWLTSMPRLRVVVSGHPLPDEGSLAAGQAAADLLTNTHQGDLLLALVSGGGSAMFEHLRPGVSLTGLQSLTDLLLRSGAPIEALNTVRPALSWVKWGGLARLAGPAQTLALILSDVVGDRLTAIASGPTVPRRPDARSAQEVLVACGLWSQAPAAIRTALMKSEGLQAMPPLAAPRPVNLLVGSSRQVVAAARAEAERLGFRTRLVTRRLQGEAREAGAAIAGQALRLRSPACLLFAGETTVTVGGAGRGGRNQELALAAALALDGAPNIALMALATDGVDGPTDAAGAIVTGETAARLRARGLDPHKALHANDAYPALDAVGALIRTGPTGTNLNDVIVALTYP